ncbi:4Fe-4S cluster-binding domain-containing protein, partial [Streptococcus sp. 121]|uniref:radical SAM protein n=1 Tax=Streptococcus sp. 121 TaxID=2797637 RepID=UPI0018F0AFD1
MAYEVVNGTLIPIKEKGQIKKIPLDSIYYRNLTEDYALVINSFKNKILIVDASCIRNNMLEISEEMEELLVTPTRYPDSFSVDNLYDNQKILNAYNSIYISFAITYSCNLRCSYCFQQQYKSLVRKPITLEELEETLAQISILISDNPKLNISFGLFGGEPLLPQNEPIIDRIFQYCVEHKIKIDITTNGIFLPFFAKKLIIHRGIISGIAITVNTLPENYEEAVKITKVANNTKKLLKITQVLLDFGLTIDVGTNFDRTNIDNLINLFNYFKEHGYFSKSNFFWNGFQSISWTVFDRILCVLGAPWLPGLLFLVSIFQKLTRKKRVN